MTIEQTCLLVSCSKNLEGGLINLYSSCFRYVVGISSWIGSIPIGAGPGGTVVLLLSTSLPISRGPSVAECLSD